MTTIAEERPGRAELLALYEAVGWTTSTRAPETLVAAITGSDLVLAARDADGSLVGLVRALTDGATVVLVQDLLVVPSRQRSGIGADLLDAVLAQYAHVRQTVLLTDAEPGQRAFYESRGLVEAHDVEPSPLRSFVLLR